MIEHAMEFVALSDVEQQDVVGGEENWMLKLLVTYLINNAGAFVDGIKDGYADGRG